MVYVRFHTTVMRITRFEHIADRIALNVFFAGRESPTVFDFGTEQAKQAFMQTVSRLKDSIFEDVWL